MDQKTLEIISQSDEFMVPLGIDPKGNPVRPFQAQKGVPYLCPECKERLILRKGDVRAHHFSHRQDSECNPETRLHKSAKALVVKMVNDLIAGAAKSPKLFSRHSLCGGGSSGLLTTDITRAEEEYRLPFGRILDVAILNGDKVVLGVEIYVTHRVCAMKRNSMTEIPWVEVGAWNIIHIPHEWDCLEHNLVFPWCSACNKIAKKMAEPPPPPPPPPARLPYIPPSLPHETTAMSERKVEMCIDRLPEVLDIFPPMGKNLELPSGGVVADPSEFFAAIKSDLAHADELDICQKKALLWRTSEYLVAMRTLAIKGATPLEVEKNAALADEAIKWLTGK